MINKEQRAKEMAIIMNNIAPKVKNISATEFTELLKDNHFPDYSKFLTFYKKTKLIEKIVTSGGKDAKSHSISINETPIHYGYFLDVINLIKNYHKNKNDKYRSHHQKQEIKNTNIQEVSENIKTSIPIELEKFDILKELFKKDVSDDVIKTIMKMK